MKIYLQFSASSGRLACSRVIQPHRIDVPVVCEAISTARTCNFTALKKSAVN
jgi:hypothetical protein